MAYLDRKTQENRPTAIIGVVAIHAAIGYVLVSGLGVQIVEIVSAPPFQGTNVEVELPPPPPPDQVEDPAPSSNPTVYTPPRQLDLDRDPPDIITTIDPPELDNDIVLKIDPAEDGPAVTPPPPPPPPSFDPVSARPRNNPGGWVTTNDYRAIWINREYTGIARFELSVGTNGRVSHCRITSSTGHAALDEATCKLVKRRARFDPAKDSSGKNGSRDLRQRGQLGTARLSVAALIASPCGFDLVERRRPVVARHGPYRNVDDRDQRQQRHQPDLLQRPTLAP